MTKKLSKKIIRKRLMKECWSLVKEIVQAPESCLCYTCDKILEDPFERQAGHRYHGCLDFDLERNIRVQCVGCNKFRHGNLGEFERRLIKEFGIEWSDSLKADALSKRNDYTIQELEAIKIKLSQQLSDVQSRY